MRSKEELKVLREQFGELPAISLQRIDASGQEIIDPIPGEIKTEFKPTVSVLLHTGPAPKVQQQYKDETDINLILAKYGVHAAMGVHPPEVYRDVSKSYDYMEAFNAVEEAKAAFAALPAEARRALGEDPLRLMELSQTASGIRELISMGFTDTPPQKAPESSGASSDKALEEPKK